MAIARLYQATALKVNTELVLDHEATHYLSHVLRTKKSDIVTIFNGEGGEYRAVIDEINKKQIKVRLQEFFPIEVESPLNICLAQGLARGEKMDWIIQKAVELGVKSIVPLETAFSNVQFDAKRLAKRMAHWQRVMISACEQCGRNRLPMLSAPIAIDVWLPQAKADLCVVLTPHQTAKLTASDLQGVKNVIALVGPEGGFHADEIKNAQQAGFKLLQLGPRVLRTETAGLAAITIFQAYLADMALT